MNSSTRIRAQFRSEFDLYSIAVFSWSNVLARHRPVEYSAIRSAIFARMLSVIGRKCPWRASARQDPLSALRRLKKSKKNNSRPSYFERLPQKEFASVFLETGNEITTKRGESFVPCRCRILRQLPLHILCISPKSTTRTSGDLSKT